MIFFTIVYKPIHIWWLIKKQFLMNDNWAQMFYGFYFLNNLFQQQIVEK